MGKLMGGKQRLWKVLRDFNIKKTLVWLKNLNFN